MLDEVREKHVLATRERFGLESDEAEEARHRALDLVAERLGLRLPRECRGVQRADQIEGDARARARRVDGELGGVPERLNPFRADAGGCEPLFPLGGDPRRVLLDREPGVARSGFVHPGLEARGRRIGKRQEEVAEVALRIEGKHGHAGRERLLEEDEPEAGLARAGHPDDHSVGRQVARLERQRLPVCSRAQAELVVAVRGPHGRRPYNGGSLVRVIMQTTRADDEGGDWFLRPKGGTA